jgi:hypothetical protein
MRDQTKQTRERSRERGHANKKTLSQRPLLLEKQSATGCFFLLAARLLEIPKLRGFSHSHREGKTNGKGIVRVV